MTHLSICSSQDDTMTGHPKCDCGETMGNVMVLVDELAGLYWSSGVMSARGQDGGNSKWPAKRKAIHDAIDAALTNAYADGRKDERDRCEGLCAAEQAENRELAKGSKTAMYDWMADGAGLCLGAIRSNA